MKKTFTKEERICSRKLISRLFSQGRTFQVKPFRITWMRMASGTDFPAQVMMSVPKYNIRSAVQRNLIRRRMKEAYRLNKQPLYENLNSSGHQLAFCITYTAKEIMDYGGIQAKIILLLHRLTEADEKVTG